MKIVLREAGKRFQYQWIFKNLHYDFTAGKTYAVTGPNGSGKSTLLKVLSGHLSLSKGEASFLQSGTRIDGDKVYRHISFAAPYMELIEELTLREALRFHLHFKKALDGFGEAELYELLKLPGAAKREIRFFSSGMKQRLKLLLAILSDCPVLLLDEPSTNLDAEGVEWYQQLLRRYVRDRLVVIASNVAEDYAICEEEINILDYKHAKSRKIRG